MTEDELLGLKILKDNFKAKSERYKSEAQLLLARSDELALANWEVEKLINSIEPDKQ